MASSYAPTTIADMHRVRHLAWELPELGWDVEVLFAGSGFQRPEYLEPDSLPLFNPAVVGHSVDPQDFWFFRPLGIRSIGWRALRPLKRAGDALLATGRFDLVFISTGNFNLFCLGRGWSRRFHVPCVLDFHDPWVSDRVDYSTTTNRPKRWVAAALSRRLERIAIDGASGIVAVSPVYVEALRKRYPNSTALQLERSEAIPFAAREGDFSAVDKNQARPKSETIDIVYVGAGGAIMARSFALICQVFGVIRERNPTVLANLKIRLYGTYAYWKEGQPKPLQEIAARYQLFDVVEERPARIPYLHAMDVVQRSCGLLLLGVDDTGYVPSKLFTYALSGKPLLASFRSGSAASRLFEQMPGIGHLLSFESIDGPPTETNISIARSFLGDVLDHRRFNRRILIDSVLAPAMAAKHAALFERICRSREAHGGAGRLPASSAMHC